MFKAVLPRATDLINDMLALLAKTEDPSQIEVFICDAKDAFWQIPLHRDERRFYCAKLAGKYVAYNRNAQGSRGAPLSWTIIFDLVCRCCLSWRVLPGRYTHCLGPSGGGAGIHLCVVTLNGGLSWAKVRQ